MDRFTIFIERLLEYMNPFLGPRSIILLDNASIHFSERVTALYRAKGVILEYLPPYLSQFNPIEMSFYELKQWIRKNRQLGDEYEHNFEVFLRIAMESTAQASAAGYFRAAGYGDPLKED